MPAGAAKRSACVHTWIIAGPCGRSFDFNTAARRATPRASTRRSPKQAHRTDYHGGIPLYLDVLDDVELGTLR